MQRSYSYIKLAGPGLEISKRTGGGSSIMSISCGSSFRALGSGLEAQCAGFSGSKQGQRFGTGEFGRNQLGGFDLSNEALIWCYLEHLVDSSLAVQASLATRWIEEVGRV